MLTSLTSSSPDTSPTRLPVRQKASLDVPKFPKLTLPPLPPITNPGIRRMALTHSSCHSGDQRRNRELITNPEEAVLDYEKLEHVGDGLLTAAIVTLLHDKYPAFGPGPATFLRGNMVSNRALSQIAEQYKIPEMVIAEQASKYMLQGGEKVKGSLFEAYVAGVYYSFLHPREGELEAQARPEVKKPQEGPSDGPSVSAQVKESVLDTTSTEPKIPALTTKVVDPRPSLDPITPPGQFIVPSHSSPSPIRRSSSNVDSMKGLPAISEIKPDPVSSPTTSDSSTTPTPTIGPTPTLSHQSTPNPRTHGQAFDHICQWLWPLFHPIAIFLTVQLRSDPQFSSISTPISGGGPSEGESSGLIITQRSGGLCVVPEIWKLEDERAVGAVGALNQFLGRHYGSGVLPTWLTRSKGQQVWKLTCIVKTPEGKEIKAEAKRLTKRKAMNVAAYQVWQELKKLEEEEEARRAKEEGTSDDDDGDDDEGGMTSLGRGGNGLKKSASKMVAEALGPVVSAEREKETEETEEKKVAGAMGKKVVLVLEKKIEVVVEVEAETETKDEGKDEGEQMRDGTQEEKVREQGKGVEQLTIAGKDPKTNLEKVKQEKIQWAFVP